MPPSAPLEYNPNILGFTEDQGPVVMSLEKARSIYGKLPSDYKFVPKKDGRQNKKGLNLDIGKLVTETLENGRVNLKQAVFTFFQGWHRNYESEFGINMDPFLNLNHPGGLKDILRANREAIQRISHLNLRAHLSKHQRIRRDILNSIPEKDLSRTAERILNKKIKQLDREEKRTDLRDTVTRIQANRIMEEIVSETSFDPTHPDNSLLSIYTDEISKKILKLPSLLPLSGIDALKGVHGRGIEFEFATRDHSYLALGKETGDCTAHKAPFQADRDTENIYWTVFPWILDLNYQILKTYYHGDLVMKFHLLPVFILQEDEGRIALAVDGIETVRSFRDDIQGFHRNDLMDNKSLIVNEAIDRIKTLAGQMGIDHIYAERFSNTRWVREHLDSLPEIYLHVNNIIKLDELEDVFTLSQELCQDAGADIPGDIFMEIQMKNTSLLPRVTSKTAGIKCFAIIQGNPAHGIPMKKVLGV